MIELIESKLNIANSNDKKYYTIKPWNSDYLIDTAEHFAEFCEHVHTHILETSGGTIHNLSYNDKSAYNAFYGQSLLQYLVKEYPGEESTWHFIHTVLSNGLTYGKTYVDLSLVVGWEQFWSVSKITQSNITQGNKIVKAIGGQLATPASKDTAFFYKIKAIQHIIIFNTLPDDSPTSRPNDTEAVIDHPASSSSSTPSHHDVNVVNGTKRKLPEQLSLSQKDEPSSKIPKSVSEFDDLSNNEASIIEAPLASLDQDVNVDEVNGETFYDQPSLFHEGEILKMAHNMISANSKQNDLPAHLSDTDADQTLVDLSYPNYGILAEAIKYLDDDSLAEAIKYLDDETLPEFIKLLDGDTLDRVIKLGSDTLNKVINKFLYYKPISEVEGGNNEESIIDTPLASLNQGVNVAEVNGKTFFDHPVLSHEDELLGRFSEDFFLFQKDESSSNIPKPVDNMISANSELSYLSPSGYSKDTNVVNIQELAKIITSLNDPASLDQLLQLWGNNPLLNNLAASIEKSDRFIKSLSNNDKLCKFLSSLGTASQLETPVSTDGDQNIMDPVAINFHKLLNAQSNTPTTLSSSIPSHHGSDVAEGNKEVFSKRSTVSHGNNTLSGELEMVANSSNTEQHALLPSYLNSTEENNLDILADCVVELGPLSLMNPLTEHSGELMNIHHESQAATQQTREKYPVISAMLTSDSDVDLTGNDAALFVEVFLMPIS
jgi:hypothetical protein